MTMAIWNQKPSKVKTFHQTKQHGPLCFSTCLSLLATNPLFVATFILVFFFFPLNNLIRVSENGLRISYYQSLQKGLPLLSVSLFDSLNFHFWCIYSSFDFQVFIFNCKYMLVILIWLWFFYLDLDCGCDFWILDPISLSGYFSFSSNSSDIA